MLVVLAGSGMSSGVCGWYGVLAVCSGCVLGALGWSILFRGFWRGFAGSVVCLVCRCGVCGLLVFFCQAGGGIRDLVRSRGLGDVFMREVVVVVVMVVVVVIAVRVVVSLAVVLVTVSVKLVVVTVADVIVVVVVDIVVVVVVQVLHKPGQ